MSASQFPNSEPEWDQLSIDTPELVTIDMPVAGLGSRFVALLVDYLIWLALLVLIGIIVALVDPSLSRFSHIGQKWANALLILLPFLFFWGYFTLFEAFWSGRTPGKYVAKIRVIQISGRGIGLFESMTRNLVRFVDQFPGIYAIGTVSVFLSSRHQRLGDMAAGTLVVHERERLESSISSAALSSLTSLSGSRTFTEGFFAKAKPAERRIEIFLIPQANLKQLGPKDLEVLEGFFARRLDFTLEMRIELARRIADGIVTKTAIAIPPEVPVETFLEEIAHQLRDLSRMR